MPTYQETLEWSYKCYPTLFAYEIDVLDHLFFVIGNGYEWKDGELVDKCNESFEEAYFQAKKQREWNNKHFKSEFIKSRDRLVEFLKEKNLIEKSKNLLAKLEPFREETDDWQLEQKIEIEKRKKYCTDPNLYNIGNSYRFNEDGLFYRNCRINENYSAIMNIPDDVKSDWLEAVEKTIQLIEEKRLVLSEEDHNLFVPQIKNRISEIKNKTL